jgi:hypothetical protein
MRWAVRALAPIVAVLAAACGSTGPTAYAVVYSYLAALGEGNYTNACALLAHSARSSLPGSCQSVFARCLPNEAAAYARDQTQQLYASIYLTTTRNTATALVSGTAVARTVRRVTLADQRGNWVLTSPGEKIERCRR